MTNLELYKEILKKELNSDVVIVRTFQFYGNKYEEQSTHNIKLFLLENQDETSFPNADISQKNRVFLN